MQAAWQRASAHVTLRCTAVARRSQPFMQLDAACWHARIANAAVQHHTHTNCMNRMHTRAAHLEQASQVGLVLAGRRARQHGVRLMQQQQRQGRGGLARQQQQRGRCWRGQSC